MVLKTNVLLVLALCGDAMLLFNLRQGIGFDIEYNEDIQHTLSDGETDVDCEFMGVIIKIPFVSIYIGDFYEKE